MQFRILGPLEVIDNGEALDVGGSKQRALLAMLLLNANQVVSRDRLIEALWDEDPPETARKALQVYVSQLRRVLGKERLVTRTPGYVLVVGKDELDLARFESRHERAKNLGPVEAAKQLREALALWRGAPLADFTYDGFAQSEIARLEELHITCLEERIDADLARGGAAELIGELEALVKQFPLRERPRSQLMVSLYRCGRHAEALDAYQSGRSVLVGELGIEPSKSLRELEQAILRQDPSLDVPATRTVEAGDAARRSVFVGRDRELTELVASLDDAFGGRGRLVLLAGEPGIGKSRLAEELADRARARGARVLVGRCWEAGGAPSYWPWVQSLRGYVRGTEAEALAAQLGSGARELAQVLPELRTIVPGIAEPAAAESEGARFQLFDAAREFIANASRSRPVVLVLDDLHAADAPSLLLLQFLARELASMRLLIIGAYRDVDPIPRHPLTDMLAEVTREPTTRRISLAGLNRRDVADYLHLTASEFDSEDLATLLYEETEGNPLFVSETVRLLTLESARPVDSVLTIPQSVRDVISRRLEHLDDECSRVLAVASVLGRDFAVDTLARASDVGIDALLDTLDEAMTVRVVAEVPGSPHQLRFAHALIRDTLYEGLSAARRVRLHRLVVDALEAHYGEEPGPHLNELAHHCVAGSDFDRALAYARRAGDHALSQLAYEDAARLYQTALDALELVAPADARARCELLLSLGEAELRAGEADSAKRAFLAAADIADALAMPREFARAVVGYGGRIVWARAADDDRLVPLLESAVARLPDDELILRSRLLARLGGALRDDPVLERRRALTAEALELARRSGDPQALANALDSRIVSIQPAPPVESLRLADELLEVVTQSGDRERAVHGHVDRAYSHLQRGEVEAGRQALTTATGIAEQLRQPTQLWFVLAIDACIAAAEGRFAYAEELADVARTTGMHAQPHDALATHALHRYTMCGFRGWLDEAEPILSDAVAKYPARPVFRCALTHLYARRGDLEQASRLLQELATDDFAGVPIDPDWLCAMSFLIEACTVLEDEKTARTSYGLMRPFADWNVSNLPEGIRGAAARYLALAAATAGDRAEAARMFGAAIELNERMGFRPWLAYTQEDFARFLLAEDAQATRAQELLGAAIATFEELGMHDAAGRAGGAAPARAGVGRP